MFCAMVKEDVMQNLFKKHFLDNVFGLFLLLKVISLLDLNVLRSFIK